ncbi:MAG: hypothetical protein ACK4SI_06440 [Brevundimonas aurantiaca]|uniref:hypothetical protein n=1 Tax=Brevundimonas aurantiaca TaxID=74316 RepID=UPI00391DBBF2
MKVEISREDFKAFSDELEQFVSSLDTGFRARFRRSHDAILIWTNPVDRRHPRLEVSASQTDLSFSLGSAGDDEIPMTSANARWVLAVLDACRDGRVRYVTMKSSLMPAFAVMLTTRGLNEFSWIGQGETGQRLIKAGPRKVHSYPITGWQEALG